jgi:ABC-type multidrug transport system fused ATPase/permease subunit
MMAFSGWAYSGEKLTTRLREMVFRRMLQQEIGWHDLPDHSTGRLAAALSGDTALVKATAGESLGMAVQSQVSLIAALAIAFYSSWQLTLVVMATIPGFLIGGLFEMKVVAGFSKGAANAYKEAGHVVVESVYGIRTVQSFSMQVLIGVMFSK